MAEETMIPFTRNVWKQITRTFNVVCRGAMAGLAANMLVIGSILDFINIIVAFSAYLVSCILNWQGSDRVY
jgi:hypothetical protein